MNKSLKDSCVNLQGGDNGIISLSIVVSKKKIYVVCDKIKKYPIMCPVRESNPGRRNHNAKYSPLYELDQLPMARINYIYRRFL